MGRVRGEGSQVGGELVVLRINHRVLSHLSEASHLSQIGHTQARDPSQESTGQRPGREGLWHPTRAAPPAKLYQSAPLMMLPLDRKLPPHLCSDLSIIMGWASA